MACSGDSFTSLAMLQIAYQKLLLADHAQIMKI
jgi:hypothetical protein